ncbi:PorT family protein [Antarcticibacterium flavum]|uniref:PorT family protein n=1 Tax=Antarcticibacterium flavum TaxID=2058175 RepID=A0A5B7X2I8_9FLAO|nr:MULTISPECIES: outer membrane beta-barrel protein [Antarcticibacterium]MCM4159221.1 hypothetical protein [Antarcticibacterium sp. W02-3]QCY69617.1 PorT family protein [Antarcticibacterium flavum]
MMLKRSLFLLAFFLIFGEAFSQKRYPKDVYNTLGIQAGINYGGLSSDNLSLSPGVGFSAGLSTRANVYNNFLFLYGIKYFQYNTGIDVRQEGRSELSQINLRTNGVQLNFFGGHKIIGDHLSIEAGPVIQINSKLLTNEGYENAMVDGYLLTAESLEDISKINFALAGQVSAGLRRLKVWAQYQYGLSNMFRNLEPEEEGGNGSRVTDLQGVVRLATAGIVFYF